MVICFTCNKRIEGQVLTALDKTYHPEHFVCEKCKKPICDNKFRTHDGRAYCEEDYNRLFVSHCYGCGQPISGKFISALGHDWHEEHFICSWCNNKLVGQTFMEHQGKPICQRCFKDKVATKCKRCGEGIVSKVIKALEATWHPNCFQCEQKKTKAAWFIEVDRDLKEVGIKRNDIQERIPLKNKLQAFQGFQEKTKLKTGKAWSQERKEQQRERMRKYWASQK